MKKNARVIFPKVLTRIAGGVFQDLEKLNSPELEKHTKKLFDLHARIEDSKNTISQELLDFCHSLSERKVQNIIQNYRRDLYNGRLKRNEPQEAVFDLLPASIVEKAIQHQKLQDEYQSLLKSGEELFENEAANKRESLMALAQKEHLNKGLTLSSHTLYERIKHFTRGKNLKNKKARQTEIGLLKYLSRIYAKTSPFSTFTSICLAEVDPATKGIALKEKEALENRNVVRLNNFIFRSIKTALFNCRLSFYHFPVSLNPSIFRESSQFRYLINFNNIESIKRIESNQVLEEIFSLLKNTDAPPSFGNLAQALIKIVAASDAEVEQYLLTLINNGFLEFNLPVSGIDPNWDQALAHFLKCLNLDDNPIIERTISILTSLRHQCDELGRYDAAQRKKSIQQAYTELVEYFIHIEKEYIFKERPVPNHENNQSAYFRLKPENVFYEDTATGLNVTIGNKELDDLLERVDKLIVGLNYFEPISAQRKGLSQFFNRKYGPENEIPLLTFYEDYFRFIHEANKKKKEENKNWPVIYFPTNNHFEQQKWKDHFAKRIFEKLPEQHTETIHIEEEDLSKVNEIVGTIDTEIQSSYSLFSQLFRGKDGGLMATVNILTIGYGKMFSRFLHIFEKPLIDQVRKWNDHGADEYLMVEEHDASYFNANLHPPMLDYEILIPGGHSQLPKNKQLLVSDLTIKYSKKENELKLYSPELKRSLSVHDMGFQSLNGRSKLFDLLNKFTQCRLVMRMLIHSALRKHSNDSAQEGKAFNSKIDFRPRVVFEDKIILQRKYWIVDKDEIPQKSTEESDWHYFVKLDHWRRSHGMPTEIFIVINPHLKGNLQSRIKKEINSDDTKPQYINFSNLFLVKLFEKSSKRVMKKMSIVEMLPNSRQLLKTNKGEKYVSEFVIQWHLTNSDSK
ncbi:MAG: lantibiotic dehydratase [Phaeodactylibacter sp.]|nr:lantibiotic dehydratase [Phaeodactylibacter sp.]